MTSVRFVDTSILLNLLKIPGRDQNRERVAEEFSKFVTSGITLILPTAAIIETGNRIRHVKADGQVRRSAAMRFDKLLRRTVANEAPWELNGVDWSSEFLLSICDGSGTGMSLIDHAVGGVGVGDLTILADATQHWERTGISDVRVWPLDQDLNAHQLGS